MSKCHGAGVWCQTGQASRHGPLRPAAVCLNAAAEEPCRAPRQRARLLNGKQGAAVHASRPVVMPLAYRGGPWGQGPVPDWAGQSARATPPCCCLPERCSRGTLQGTSAARMAHGDLMGNKGQLYMPAVASLSTFGQDAAAEEPCKA